MEARDNGKLNFKALATSLGISRMTIYRVLNNAPGVRRTTRSRVIEALNRYGQRSYATQRKTKVLFDFCTHPYLTYYGELLMRHLSRLHFNCTVTDHRRNQRDFLNAAGDCEIAVFASIPDAEVIELARRENPDLYTINISTRSDADVTVSPDNTRGGELAADHFFAMGHRHVAVHLCERHPNRFERWSAFFARMKMHDPECRIDAVTEAANERTSEVLKSYFENVDEMPTGIFFLAGEYAENYLMDFLSQADDRFRNLSIATFDHPWDLEFRHLHYDFDRIEFSSRDLIEWAEYYIINRPLMKKRSPIRTCINVNMVVTGSVKPIGGEKNKTYVHVSHNKKSENGFRKN